MTQKSTDIIETNMRWAEVDENVYIQVRECLDELNSLRSFTDKEAEQIICVIGNSLYLIYERLYRKTARDIDYRELLNFAIGNRELLRYIFTRAYPHENIRVLEKWTCPYMNIILTNQSITTHVTYY